MISVNSRYAKSAIVAKNDPIRGLLQEIEVAIPTLSTFNFTYHQMAEGDTVDGLAYGLYGDGRYWWKVATLNPEIIDWFDVPVGTVIRLPSV